MADLDDLRAAVDWSLDGDSEHAVRIVAALSIQAAQQDTAGIGDWAQRCSPRAETASPPLRTAVLAAAAFSLFRQGDPAAGVVASDALRDGLPLGCPATYLPHMTLGAALQSAGRVDEGRAAYTAGRAALDAIGAPVNGHAHLFGAEVLGTADTSTAAELAAAALLKAQESGNPTALAIAWWAVGLSCSVDDPSRATTAISESLALTRAGSGDGVYGISLCLAAALSARQGNRSAALASLNEAVRHGRDTGNAMTVGGAAGFGVQVMADIGEPDTAAVLAGMLDTTLAPFAYLLPVPEQSIRQAKLDQVRQELGIETFDAAFRRGQAMSNEEIVNYLLADIQRLEAALEGPSTHN